ncbi:lipocalin family protein [Aureisphaera galaxeae]|uniref:lipocalin family protein n=1 Tax=Aureisphaera galaxeae TaxID=1538023 RepID=UPI0023500756|nr:lipocalin family protein [Aureisphaera galaxeae]MDC8004218.1 lipocalin family protein [Aureisphaera galaxeae]
MKKVMMLLAVIAIMAGCGTPKTVIESKKVIKGDWVIDDITYSEKGTFNITMFQDTSKECFEGSSWRFIPNNNSGYYSITDGNCPTGERNFIFTIQEIDPDTGLYDFLLKPTTKLGKPDKDRAVGFRLRLAQLSNSSMRWEQTVQLEGKPFTITMNFSKINE